jgi:hypothetical protein
MGCCNSSGGDAAEPSTRGSLKEAGKLEGHLLAKARERLNKLADLDGSTKIPFILVELTGEGHENGEIEICGKDEYGVYEQLDRFFMDTWGCTKMDQGSLEDEEGKLPFCSAQYKWPGYKLTEEEGGLNNMGLSAMKLIDYMCGTLSWTLAVVNGGNVGKKGDVREMQVIFKAPHPMNLAAPHLMIEIRSAGYIELSADLEKKDMGILDKLNEVCRKHFHAKRLQGYEDYCDRYYKAGDDVFSGSSGGGDSNLGLLTTIICDEIVKLDGWNLVACDTGNYGELSEHEEQRLVYRRDYHPMTEAPYLFITLSNSGTVEIAGRDTKEVFKELDEFFKGEWQCEFLNKTRLGHSSCVRYKWPEGEDLMMKSGEVIAKMDGLGWEMQLTSQGAIKVESGEQSREQQLVFRAEATEVGAVMPQLFVEMYAGEGADELYQDEEEPTQVTGNQYIRWIPIGPPDKMAEIGAALAEFILEYLGGAQISETRYGCGVFLCRGRYENNLAQWTMRLCDFLVDRHAWSFMGCSLCSTGEYGQFRSQQMVFRWENDKRDVPVTNFNFSNLNPSLWAEDAFPDYWKSGDELKEGKEIQKVVPCTDDEKNALQEMVDSTFKRTLTRDRQPDDDAPDDEEMPYRLEILHGWRSEHAWLHHKLLERRSETEVEETFEVKTATPSTFLTSRLAPGEGYLFHATNPSSAMSILKTGFVLDHAGKNVGSMYGAGVYAAECSSKSDEYARDDGGNTYPSLFAFLVCRCFVGKPHIVYQASAPDSPATLEAKDNGFDSVVGDREKKAGTYREFVFFDERAVYPEMCVIYRRIWNPTANGVTDAMRVPTTGTTGRFWQIRQQDRTWKNIPTELNNLIIQAKAAGETVVACRFRGADFEFNLEEKCAKNVKSGWKSPIRAPMV